MEELRCSYRESNATRPAPDEDEEDSTGGQDELGSGDVDAGDTTVCGTDNRTYPSVCHLLQNTVNEHVLHAGSCGARQCRGGPVRNVLWLLVYTGMGIVSLIKHSITKPTSC